MTAEPVFQEHVSGLLVPREHVRQRQVWTSQERALLNRTAKMLHARGINQPLECQNEACRQAPLQRLENGDGGFTLRCRCTDRVFSKSF